MDRSKCGVVYYASGELYIKEANNSAKSVKTFMMGVPTAIITDGKGKEFIDESLFDQIIFSESLSEHKIRKLGSLADSPFEKTLYLDTDTEILEPVWELFELLDNFDLAMAHAPRRSGRLPGNVGLECFPECNTGVLLYNKNQNISDFIDSWIKLYKEFQEENITQQVQGSFRKALYSSKIKFYILPPEYNLRTVFPYFAGDMKVKIIHGRGISMDRAKRNINNSINIRVGNFKNGFLVNKLYELFYRFF